MQTTFALVAVACVLAGGLGILLGAAGSWVLLAARHAQALAAERASMLTVFGAEIESGTAETKRTRRLLAQVAEDARQARAILEKPPEWAAMQATLDENGKPTLKMVDVPDPVILDDETIARSEKRRQRNYGNATIPGLDEEDV